MKSLWIAFLLVSTLSATAGKKSPVVETSYKFKKFDAGNQNALSVLIEGAEQKDVEKAFKKLMKKTNGKIKTKGNEMFVDDGVWSDITEHPLDVYAAFIEDKKGVMLYVAIDFGGAYLTSSANNSEFKTLSKILEEFALELASSSYEDEIKDAEKELESRKKELSKLEKDEKGYEKDIEKLKGKIEDSKSAQNKQKSAIEEQEKVVSELKKLKKQLK